MHTLNRMPGSWLPQQRLVRAAKRAWQVHAWKLSGMVVTRYYERLLRKHGRSPQALDEREDDKEREFYEHLFHGVDLTERLSVLDIGCGMGDLIDFLQMRNVSIVSYLGIDLVGQFVDVCRSEYLAPCRFQKVNFISPSFAARERFNLIANMGVMVSRVVAYEDYIAYSIEKMLRFAEKDIVFNVITEVDSSLGNYREAHRVGGITYLPAPRLRAIVERELRGTRADYHIHDARIYPDAVDTFVRIAVRP